MPPSWSVRRRLHRAAGLRPSQIMFLHLDDAFDAQQSAGVFVDLFYRFFRFLKFFNSLFGSNDLFTELLIQLIQFIPGHLPHRFVSGLLIIFHRLFHLKAMNTRDWLGTDTPLTDAGLNFHFRRASSAAARTSIGPATTSARTTSPFSLM